MIGSAMLTSVFPSSLYKSLRVFCSSPVLSCLTFMRNAIGFHVSKETKMRILESKVLYNQSHTSTPTHRRAMPSPVRAGSWCPDSFNSHTLRLQLPVRSLVWFILAYNAAMSSTLSVDSPLHAKAKTKTKAKTNLIHFIS